MKKLILLIIFICTGLYAQSNKAVYLRDSTSVFATPTQTKSLISDSTTIANIEGLSDSLSNHRILLNAHTDSLSAHRLHLNWLTDTTQALRTDVNLKLNKTAFADSFAADFQAQRILDSIKTVDGTGSGLDADQLDGYEGSEFGALAENETVTGKYTFADSAAFDSTINGMYFNLGNTTYAQGNTAIGYNAAQKIDYANRADYSIGTHFYAAATQATENTAVGAEALREITLPSDNTAVGSRTLRDLTLGYHNTAVGHYSQGYSITGVQNTSIGTFSMKYLISGEMNFAGGMEALQSNAYGNENVAIGKQTMYYNVIGHRNTAVGRSALHYNTTNNDNSALGYFALYDLIATHDTITSFTDYSGTVAGTILVTSTGHGRTTGDSVLVVGSTNYDGGFIITVVDANNFYYTDTYVEDETVGYWTLAGQEGKNNIGIGAQTGRGLVYGSNNTIIGANVTGLADSLSNNIILATGDGVIHAQYNGNEWDLDTLGATAFNGSITGTSATFSGAGSFQSVSLSKANNTTLSLTETGTSGSGQAIGFINIYGKDSGGNNDLYSEIAVTAVDYTSTSEDSKIEIYNMVAGSLTEALEINGINATLAGDLVSGTHTLTESNNPILALTETGTSGNGQTIGLIDFKGKDSGGNTDTYTEFVSTAVDWTSTSEDGKLEIFNMVAGSSTEALELNGINLTLAGDLTVSGNNQTFGNGAAFDNTQTDTLKITETVIYNLGQNISTTIKVGGTTMALIDSVNYNAANDSLYIYTSAGKFGMPKLSN